jgi:hypothetical protein
MLMIHGCRGSGQGRWAVSDIIIVSVELLPEAQRQFLPLVTLNL